MEYLVYKNSFFVDQEKIDINNDLEIKVFKPLPWKLYFDKSIEKMSFRTSLFRLYISLLSLGKTKIYFAIDKILETLFIHHVLFQEILSIPF